MLSDGHKNRLMVGSGVDGRQLVNTSWETGRNISSQNTASGCSVQALEECKDVGVRGGGLRKTVK
jgi:hypothetical protein